MLKNIDFNKAFKFVLIGYAVFFVIGIIFSVIWGGVNLSIDFKGGTRISYDYVGDVDFDAVKDKVQTTIGKDVIISENVGLSGDSKSLIVTLVGEESLSTESQQAIEEALVKTYPDNKFSFEESKSVSPSLAGSFFLKCLVAVLIAGVLVTVYVGIRFRKIGGVSAAITAFAALFLDVFAAFFTCTIFNLPIDMNFVAVLLTILGYSLNDTIVIYDRIREDRTLYHKLSTANLVNGAVNKVKTRTFITTITTFLAVVMIIVVAEFFGLSSLRSFAIPMAIGLISGCISSLFVSAPLWVLWKNYSEKKAKN